MNRTVFVTLLLGLLFVAALAALDWMPPKPVAEMRVVGSTPRPDQSCDYEIELVNLTDGELGYWGFEKDAPLFEMEILKDCVWKKFDWESSCVTIVSEQYLHGHERLRLKVRVPVAPARVGLQALPVGYEGITIFEFEWLPASIRTRLVNWQEQRRERKMREMIVWSRTLEASPSTAPIVGVVPGTAK